MARTNQKKRSPSLPNHIQKGNAIEQIVAMLHNDPTVEVEPKAKLRSKDNSCRRREIDVLVTTRVLGREMHLAFECKNFGERIGVGKVGEFSDRLDDVGIPQQFGIMVAGEKGFTRDALDRAKQIGIQTMVLDGLDQERLRERVHEAFQPLVFLLLQVKRLTVTNKLDRVEDASDLLILRDEDGNVAGTLLDLIWAKWRDREIPYSLGDHQIELDIPPTWRWIVGDLPVTSTASAEVSVAAIVVTEIGTATRVALYDAQSGEFDRGRVDVDFSEFREPPTVTTVLSEDDLAKVLAREGIASIVVGRVPLPRIRYNIYWPPSERVIKELTRLADQAVAQGRWRPGILGEIPFEEIEGTDLSVMWEPIWREHPAARELDWPWYGARKRKPVPRKSRSAPTSK